MQKNKNNLCSVFMPF